MTADTSTYAEREAEALGTQHGTAAGTWVVDGNTSDDTKRAILQASDDGEFFNEIAADLSGPLSGEFADGYSPRQLSNDTGVDEGSDEFDDLCNIYEEAYYMAFETEAVRSALASLPESE